MFLNNYLKIEKKLWHDKEHGYDGFVLDVCSLKNCMDEGINKKLCSLVLSTMETCKEHA